MRSLAAVALVGLLAFTPLASASATYQGQIQTRAPVLGPLTVPSNPVVQNADTYPLTLGPGDEVVATLTWADTSGLPVGNDLDLALGPPGTEPTPLLPPDFNPADVLAWAQDTASATLVRVQCGNFVAQSHDHLPGGSSEHIDYKVPSAGAAGTYRLTVTGFLVTKDQPYTLTLTVLDGSGNDITAASVGQVQYTPFVRTSAACQLM